MATVGHRSIYTEAPRHGWTVEDVEIARLIAAQLIDKLSSGGNCFWILGDLRQTLGMIGSRPLCELVGLGHDTWSVWEKLHHRWYDQTKLEQVRPKIERFFLVGECAPKTICRRGYAPEDLARAELGVRVAVRRINNLIARESHHTHSISFA